MPAIRMLALLAVSTLASLVMAESFLRCFKPQPLGFSYLTDQGFYLHVPGRSATYHRDDFTARVSINELGFRGDEFAIPKPAGRFRVLALGDSFTEGLQVDDDELFTVLIQRAFEGDPQRVEVLNLGVSGFGSYDELRVLRAFGPKLEPDLVVVFFCLANDVRNNLLGSPCQLDDGELSCRAPEPLSGRALWISRMKSLAGTYSHLYQILRAATDAPFFRRIGMRGELTHDGTPEIPFGTEIYLVPEPAYMTEGLALTRELLREIADLSASLGAKTELVLIPIREQVESERWASILEDSAGATLVRDRPQRTLTAVGRSLDIPVIDLLPAFLEREASGEHLYWRIDGHFNEVGHEVAGREVTAALRADGVGSDGGRPAAFPASDP